MYVLAFYSKAPRALLTNLVDGIRLYGHRVSFFDAFTYSRYMHCDAVVTIGYNESIRKVHNDALANRKPFLALSDGFVFRRKSDPALFYAVTRNGLNAYGEHVDPSCVLPDRKEELIRLGLVVHPWRTGGDHIVVAHQHHDLCADGTDRRSWFPYAVDILRKNTSRKIIVRKHPKDKTCGDAEKLGELSTNDSLIHDLENAWALVTYDSNAAVEAVIRGIPVFTGGHTMADMVSNKKLVRIEDPDMPERNGWLDWLAYTQWTEDELALGMPWGYLMEKYVLQKSPHSGRVTQSWNHRIAPGRVRAYG